MKQIFLAAALLLSLGVLAQKGGNKDKNKGKSENKERTEKQDNDNSPAILDTIPGKGKGKDKGKNKQKDDKENKGKHHGDDSIKVIKQSDPVKTRPQDAGVPDEDKVKAEGRVIASKRVPAPVSKQFAADFPNATEVIWTKHRGKWTASFRNGFAGHTKVTYSANGERQ